jgi:hypothetical protein
VNKEALERDLELARKSLTGSASKAAQGSENRYGQAYAALVRAGYRPKLRMKYRVKG